MKKKLFATLLILVLAISLSACGGGDNGTDSKKTSTEKTETKTETKKEDKKEDSNKIELGTPIELGDYTVTVQKISTVKDDDGEHLNLVIFYDWVNNGKEATAPFVTVDFTGFQDGVETSSIDSLVLDGSVDLGIAQKEVKSGGSIAGCQDLVRVDDSSKPIEIELSELISLDDTVYTYSIDDVNSLQ